MSHQNTPTTASDTPATITRSDLVFNQLHLLHNQLTVAIDEFNKGGVYCSLGKANFFFSQFKNLVKEYEPQLNTPASKAYFDSLQSIIADFDNEINSEKPNLKALELKAKLAQRVLFSVVACLVPAFNDGE